MQLKTSCFNKTIFKKNLTRFAPVWGVYSLGLVLAVVMLYSNGGSFKEFHFANNYINDMFYIMAVFNLGYALLAAQLLFGDLYNSRMCNMLHAFPVTRESWFFTNVLSGLTFCLVPTGVMALVAAPLLMGSMFRNAVMLAFWVFLAANLQFVCFFGLAAFAAMCTANRFTMTAGYGLLNAGAMIAYWLVDTVYTPMLYGVITPTALMWNMTPMYHMRSFPFAKAEFSLWELRDAFGENLDGVMLSYELSDQWWRLWMVAAVGVAFLLLALVLYRKRDLECAGDAVAFHGLVPVFEVLCAVFVAAAVQYALENMMNVPEVSRLVLILGLAVGWFVAKMLVERSTRVFRLKNFTGLAVLAAVFGISLGLTHFDVLGIEDYQPEAAKVEKVFFETDWTGGRDLETTGDIDAMLRLQEASLAERAEDSGTYVRGYDGSWVKYVDSNDHLYDSEDENLPTTYVAEVGLTYHLEGGKIVKRRYNVWVDSEAGSITNAYLNHWEELNPVYTDRNEEFRELERALEEFEMINVEYRDEDELPPVCFEKEAALELLECVDRDLQEGHMARHPYFHNGRFRREEKRAESGYVETESLNIVIFGEEHSWNVQVYADAVHTLNWLEENGLLNWQVVDGATVRW